MPTCKDCKYYTRIDNEKGTCYGRLVMADRDIEECPMKAYHPINDDKNKTQEEDK